MKRNYIYVRGLKVGLSLLLHQWKPLKMMKNAFYFILKTRFVLKIFEFLSWRSGQVEKTAWNNLVKKQLQYTLLYTSRSKDYETMKLGQLIEYNKIISFLRKSCSKWSRKSSSRIFCILKKLNLRSKQVLPTLSFNIHAFL